MKLPVVLNIHLSLLSLNYTANNQYKHVKKGLVNKKLAEYLDEHSLVVTKYIHSLRNIYLTKEICLTILVKLTSDR